MQKTLSNWENILLLVYNGEVFDPVYNEDIISRCYEPGFRGEVVLYKFKTKDTLSRTSANLRNITFITHENKQQYPEYFI